MIGPDTHLRFVNAVEAAQRAAEERDHLIAERRSFVTETVFSHPSKIDLLTSARRAGYRITLHVVMVPADLAVLRVNDRVHRGGHDVPEQKIVDRWSRLWSHVTAAVPVAAEVFVYDNSDPERPYRYVAHFRNGQPVTQPDWPDGTPRALRALSV